jgi:hypothetical protein
MMLKRCVPLALLAVLSLAAAAPAVEIKNLRPCYHPVFLSAARTSDKLLLGDILFLTYDIDGLKIDSKTKKASFIVVEEIFDIAAKPLMAAKQTPNEVFLHLGGTRMPGHYEIQMGRNQKPGKYIVRITVKDRNNSDANTNQKSETYQFELLPPTFGIAGVIAPAIGYAGLSYATEFVLIDMKLDDKKKPDVEVTMRVLDESGKPVADPVISTLPRDLPAESNLEQENLVAMRFPFFLNRPGRFTIDIQAKDNNGKKESRLTYPVTVLDVSSGK